MRGDRRRRARPARLRQRLARCPSRLQRPARHRRPRRRLRQGPGRDDGLPARPHPHRLQHAVRGLRGDGLQPGARRPRDGHPRRGGRPLRRGPDPGPGGRPVAVRDPDDDRFGRTRPPAGPSAASSPERIVAEPCHGLAAAIDKDPDSPAVPGLVDECVLRVVPTAPRRRAALRRARLHPLRLCRRVVPEVARPADRERRSRSSTPDERLVDGLTRRTGRPAARGAKRDVAVEVVSKVELPEAQRRAVARRLEPVSAGDGPRPARVHPDPRSLLRENHHEDRSADRPGRRRPGLGRHEGHGIDAPGRRIRSATRPGSPTSPTKRSSSASSTSPTSTSSGAPSTTSRRTRPSSAGTPPGPGSPTSWTSGRSPTSARTAGR